VFVLAAASARADALPEDDHMILEPGTPAPDFTLPTGPGASLALSQLRGRPVVLAFYPADFSPVCGDQMALYNETLSEFRRLDASLLGISVDGIWCMPDRLSTGRSESERYARAGA
jgi:peroxiredoxin